jgi:hypothetical protein
VFCGVNRTSRNRLVLHGHGHMAPMEYRLTDSRDVRKAEEKCEYRLLGQVRALRSYVALLWQYPNRIALPDKLFHPEPRTISPHRTAALTVATQP